MEAFHKEQCTYDAPFNWNYIKLNLIDKINDPLYIILVDDQYRCFLIAHVISNLLLPIIETTDDYIYIDPKYRGSLLFIKLIKAYEEWSTSITITNYINLGIGSGINMNKVKELYKRLDYTEFCTIFKKRIN